MPSVTGMTVAEINNRLAAAAETAQKDAHTLYLAGSGPILNMEAAGASYMEMVPAFAYGRNFDSVINYSVGAQSAQNATGPLLYNDGPNGVMRRLAGEPSVSLSLLHYLINDLARFGVVGTAYDSAMRSIISRMRTAAGGINNASGVWPELTYDSGWTSVSNFARYLLNNTGTFTWTSQSGWMGGVVGFTTYKDTDAYGAIHTFTVDGVAAGVLSTTNTAPNFQTHRVLVPAGAGRVVLCSVSAVATITYLHEWHIERVAPPLVVLIKQPLPVDYSLYGAPTAPWTHIPTDAEVIAGNARIDAIAAEFDSFVITVALDNNLKRDPKRYNADKLHPREVGYAVMIATIWQAIENSSVVARLPIRADLVPSVAAGN